MPDVEISCVNCKEVFLFREKDQEMYYQRNMASPQRCPKCRPTRKKMENGGFSEKRYEIVCDRCGRKDTVPFVPKTGRSVMCSECYTASRTRVRSV